MFFRRSSYRLLGISISGWVEKWLKLRNGRVLLAHIFLAAGLKILSTSYTGRPGKIALKGNFLGAVRNIRVKILNRSLCS